MSNSAEFGALPSIRSLPGAVSGFFRWWARELGACVPAWLRSLFRRQHGTLVVALEPDAAVLRFRKGDRVSEIGRVPVNPAAPDAARGVVAQLVSRIRGRAAEVVLVLRRDQTLRRVIELPFAARENLREVLSFEMDRYTPFAADKVLYDLRPLSANPETQMLAVDLAVVPREVAARAIADAESWGLTPDIVCFADDPGTERPESAFVFRRPESPRADLARRLTAVLWVCAGALALALAILPLQRKQALLAEYQARLDERRIEAAAVDALRRRVREMAGVSDRLIDRKAARPSMIGLLHEVTRLVPDDTWLLQLRVSDGQLTMAGYSGAASALIPILESSDLLAEVRFEAPVTLDARIGLERFNLSADVVAGAEEGS